MIVEALSFRDWMNLLLKTDLHNVHRSHCHKKQPTQQRRCYRSTT
uniref:Uncharacterized protein n=1 Tax=Heterorhabditis bacteriophora TaxID=37862 RepID=A0A1I7WM84_HETBA